MGGKNKKSADAAGDASKQQGTAPVPQDDPVKPCDNKHWFAFRVIDEKNAKVIDVAAKINFPGGTMMVADQAASTLEGDGMWRSPKVFESGDCTIAFPELLNCEWWPQGAGAGKFSVKGSATVDANLDIAIIAEENGVRDYKTIWDRSANKAVVDTRPNANQLLKGDVFLIPDEKDKTVTKATDSVWVFVVKTKKPCKVRVLLVDKNNKPLAGKKWEVSEPVVASGTTGSDGAIEFTDLPPDAETAKIKVTMKDPLAPVTPPAAATPPKPTPYPADITAADFTDKHPSTGDDARIVNWEISLGGLPSFNAPEGVHARLYNLGFGCTVDDEDTRITRAVKAYQLFFLKQKNGSGVAKDIEADLRNRHDNP